MADPDDTRATSQPTTPPATGVTQESLSLGPAPIVGERPGDSIGPYRLLEVIGEGGFGTVWVAEQREPISRRVALKVIKPGMDSAAVIARFEQERQALAVMDHPGVARIYDAGATPLGRPYFVMEYIKGEPITAYCDRHRLTIRERLVLFARVCDAVQHAHMKGIIHRDLKPSNILVAPGGAELRPVVIDFGIAKALSQPLTDKTLFTVHGRLLGTPEYMSPEQAEMSLTDIDTRTDVYSLGVLLYELLTGSLPFDSRTLRAAGEEAIRRIIREVDPPHPSTRLSTTGAQSRRAAEDRRAHLNELAAELKGELEWIPLKALRKNRSERYRSAAEFGDDIANYLANRPLIAGPETAAYRLKKFVRRNKLPVLIGAAIAAILVAATGVSVWFGLRESAARASESAALGRETEQRAAAERIVQFLTNDLLLSVDPEHGGPDTRVADILETGRERLGGRFSDSPAVRARVARALGEAYLAIGEPAPARDLLQSALDLLGAGADPAEAAIIQNRLADARYRLSEGQSAVDAIRGQADDAATKFGARDRKTVNLRNQLGGALKDAGRLDEAEKVYREVLADRRADPNTPPVDVLITRHNLNLITLRRARILKTSGDAAGAATAYGAALADRQAITDDTTRELGPEHPQSLASRAELAGLLAESGRLPDAIEMYPGVLDSLRAVLGISHWRVLQTTARYGRALMLAGRHADAADQLLASIEGYRFVRPRDPDLFAIADAAAECLERSGRPGAAGAVLERMYDHAVRIKANSALIRRRACTVRDFYTRTGETDRAAPWEARCAAP